MSINRENVLKVANAIEQHSIPDLGFNMCDWRARSPYLEDLSGHNCGTTACIGGWTEAVLSLPTNVGADAARDALGLTDSAADELFYPNREHGSDFNPFDATAMQAVAVLRHLAETGEVDWSVAAKAGD